MDNINEQLKPRVLAFLQQAEQPVYGREIAVACGVPDVWTVRGIVRRLRADGHNIISAPLRGYWLGDKGPMPPYEAKTPPKVHARLFERGKLIDTQKKRSIDRLTYPVDWVLIRHLISEKGITQAALRKELAARLGWKTRGGWKTIRDGLKGLPGAEEHSWSWFRIWEVSRILDVPPELLVDEVKFMFGGAPGVMPERFAGYKLLFGLLKKGLTVYDAIPPTWALYDRLDDVKAHPENYPVAIKWLHDLYKGRMWLFRKPESVFHACILAEVPLAELFVGHKQTAALGLEGFYTDISALKQWDALFLAAVARLLRKCGSADEATLISELALLVRERVVWRDKFVGIEERRKQISAREARPKQEGSDKNCGGNVCAC